MSRDHLHGSPRPSSFRIPPSPLAHIPLGGINLQLSASDSLSYISIFISSPISCHRPGCDRKCSEMLGSPVKIMFFKAKWGGASGFGSGCSQVLLLHFADRAVPTP